MNEEEEEEDGERGRRRNTYKRIFIVLGDLYDRKDKICKLIKRQVYFIISIALYPAVRKHVA